MGGFDQYFRRMYGIKGELVTRFAPSPTGQLHLGHVLHALYVWGFSEAVNARVLFRLEDHDRKRCKADYSDRILDDISWMGLVPHAGFAPGSRNAISPDFKQSLNTERYLRNIRKLRLQGKVYWCGCSRRTVEKRRELTRQNQSIYDGHCRYRGLDERHDRCLRVKLGPENTGCQMSGRGLVTSRPDLLYGDFPLLDRDRHFTYQLCVVSDDLAHGVNLIVRGMDLENSSAPQEALKKMLDPRHSGTVFFHHPLLMAGDGVAKLSKSLHSEPVSSFRERGFHSRDVFGLAAHRAGLIPDPGPFGPGEMAVLLRKILT